MHPDALNMLHSDSAGPSTRKLNCINVFQKKKKVTDDGNNMVLEQDHLLMLVVQLAANSHVCCFGLRRDRLTRKGSATNSLKEGISPPVVSESETHRTISGFLFRSCILERGQRSK